MEHHQYKDNNTKFNLARLKTHGENFEIVVDPDLAMQYRKGKTKDISQVLKAENVFHDAKRGEKASEKLMEDIFGTSDAKEVAKEIIKKGDIQLTEEYRQEQREKKEKKLVDLIHRNAVNPREETPHPRKRIKNALEEANVDIDYSKTAEDQVRDVVSQIKHIIPIKFEVKDIEVSLSAEHAAKVYGTIKQFGQIKDEDWLNDGSWQGIVEIPGGLEEEFYDKLNDKTHGEVKTKVVESTTTG